MSFLPYFPRVVWGIMQFGQLMAIAACLQAQLVSNGPPFSHGTFSRVLDGKYYFKIPYISLSPWNTVIYFLKSSIARTIFYYSEICWGGYTLKASLMKCAPSILIESDLTYENGRPPRVQFHHKNRIIFQEAMRQCALMYLPFWGFHGPNRFE